MMIHKLEPLPYSYDALEPYIDAQTMQIHHSRHHQTYIDKLNAALEGYPELQKHPMEVLLRNLNEIPEAIRTAVRNHGGGHANHSFFWPILKTDVGFSGEIASAITQRFGSFEKFKADFSSAAAMLFGSGWAWLVWNNGALEIMTTSNQDSPLNLRSTPILGLDVWEHAYYLKYQNRRVDYIDAFFHVINWQKVNENFLNR
ncbi:MAG: superoxide dismutase [Deltaproteobacteria bacterium]|nr:superoxide dismutase [Deltaproteobacteria bacterium]